MTHRMHLVAFVCIAVAVCASTVVCAQAESREPGFNPRVGGLPVLWPARQ
jgi:hypothetical protein